MNNKLRAGQISAQVTFVAENFRFTFVSLGNKDATLHADENGYIWGRTNDFKCIAIHTGKDIEIQFGVRIVNTWHYIILNVCSSEQQFVFNAIKFENGAIRTVNPCNALQEDFTQEEKLNCGNERYYVYKRHNDSKEFSVLTNNEYVKWIFTSKIAQSMSIDAGASLRNDTAALLILFNEDKHLNTFVDYYRYVTDILAFLTFRRNISFEKISLEYATPEKSMISVADCYIKDPDIVETRSVTNAIRVKIIKENSVFTNLVQSAINGELPMSVIPEDSNAVYKMSGDTIKNICSALETELDRADIKLSKSQDLEQLIESVKNVIRQHKQEKNSLEQKTYDVLFGSIKHWGDSLADRIIAAFSQHKNNIQPMLSWHGVTIQNQNIIDLVKTRNDITHRAIQNIDDDVVTTAFIMYRLIYCMVLRRLGLLDSMIAVIIENRLVG